MTQRDFLQFLNLKLRRRRRRGAAPPRRPLHDDQSVDASRECTETVSRRGRSTQVRPGGRRHRRRLRDVLGRAHSVFQTYQEAVARCGQSHEKRSRGGTVTAQGPEAEGFRAGSPVDQELHDGRSDGPLV